MKKENKGQTEVMEVLNKFSDAYSRQDIDDIMELFAHDPKTVFIGTGIDEECIGIDHVKKQLQRDFDQAQKLSMDLKCRHISVSEPMAWAISELNVHTKIGLKKMDIFCRLSAVLEKQKEEWRFVNMHISTPTSGQKKGESYPTCDLY
ncbi:MAG TPA: nuclear transport factor 2 family protein [Candidatus Wallbacteria bacterium]|nr:nuclear transport factor 2 family protein [Candidatus Wallbacteria bacterium]